MGIGSLYGPDRPEVRSGRKKTQNRRAAASSAPRLAGGMGRRAKLGLGAAEVFAALAFAGSAGAAGLPQGYLPWPNGLPGRTVGPSGPPHSVPGCRSLRLSCVDRLLVRMRRE